MEIQYCIRVIVMEHGERFPVILDCNGIPDFYSTIFAMSVLRARNLASNSIENSLRAIFILNTFLDSYSINLQKRFSEGIALHMNELNSLIRVCRLPTAAIRSFLSGSHTQKIKNAKVIHLEKYRYRAEHGEPEVSIGLIVTRLMYIREYLTWRIENYLIRIAFDDPRRAQLLSIKTSLGRVMRSLSPRINRYGSRTPREGLALKDYERLLEVIKLDSADNPWCGEHTRARNELMILWLSSLGLRRGELLNVRITDITGLDDTVQIERRAGDPSDPRRKQPTVKTLGRELNLSDLLQEKTQVYISDYRSQIPLARKHSFLFVSNSGLPLSLDGCAKVFAVLRAKRSELPKDLTPHILRHTWNDNFSRFVDAGNIDEEHEKKWRSYQMGWRETSQTAEMYRRRYVREEAQNANMEMQKLKRKRGNNE